MEVFFLSQWWGKGDEAEGSEADEEDCAGVCGRKRQRDGLFSFLHVSLSPLFLGFFTFYVTCFLLSLPLASMIFLAFSSLWKLRNSFPFLFFYHNDGRRGKRRTMIIVMVYVGGINREMMASFLFYALLSRLSFWSFSFSVTRSFLSLPLVCLIFLVSSSN